jgi:hypothetical protein
MAENSWLRILGRYRRGLARHQVALCLHEAELLAAEFGHGERATVLHEAELLAARGRDGWREVFERELAPASEAFAAAMARYVAGEVLRLCDDSAHRARGPRGKTSPAA